jgi:hypothetical protein
MSPVRPEPERLPCRSGIPGRPAAHPGQSPRSRRRQSNHRPDGRTAPAARNAVRTARYRRADRAIAGEPSHYASWRTVPEVDRHSVQFSQFCEPRRTNAVETDESHEPVRYHSWNLHFQDPEIARPFENIGLLYSVSIGFGNELSSRIGVGAGPKAPARKHVGKLSVTDRTEHDDRANGTGRGVAALAIVGNVVVRERHPLRLAARSQPTVKATPPT